MSRGVCPSKTSLLKESLEKALMKEELEGVTEGVKTFTVTGHEDRNFQKRIYKKTL